MAWAIDFVPRAARELEALDPQHKRRILKFLRDRLGPIEDPRSIGGPLKGSRLHGYWKYRVGDYRVICKIEEDKLLVLVLGVGHRREVYRDPNV